MSALMIAPFKTPESGPQRNTASFAISSRSQAPGLLAKVFSNNCPTRLIYPIGHCNSQYSLSLRRDRCHCSESYWRHKLQPYFLSAQLDHVCLLYRLHLLDDLELLPKNKCSGLFRDCLVPESVLQPVSWSDKVQLD